MTVKYIPFLKFLKEIFFHTYLAPIFNPNMDHNMLKLEETLIQTFQLTDKEIKGLGRVRAVPRVTHGD